MKVEVAVLGSPSLIVLMVSVDVKQHRTMPRHWPQFVPNNYVNRHPRTLSSTSSSSPVSAEHRSCVKVEGAVLDSPSLIVLMVSVDIKQH